MEKVAKEDTGGNAPLGPTPTRPGAVSFHTPVFEGFKWGKPSGKPDLTLDLTRLRLRSRGAAAHLPKLPASHLRMMAALELWHHLEQRPFEEARIRPLTAALAKVVEGAKELRTAFDELEREGPSFELECARMDGVPEALAAIEAHQWSLTCARDSTRAMLPRDGDTSEPHLEAWRVLMRAAGYGNDEIASLEIDLELHRIATALANRRGSRDVKGFESEAQTLYARARAASKRASLRDLDKIIHEARTSAIGAVKVAISRFRARCKTQSPGQ